MRECLRRWDEPEGGKKERTENLVCALRIKLGNDLYI